MPPPLPVVTYSHRFHALSSETSYRLQRATLFIKAKGGKETSYPLSDVTQLRLRFHPTRVQRNRYLAELTLNGRSAIKFSNEHYRGVYDFEDRSDAYSKFVTELCQDLSEQSECEFFGGNSRSANRLIWLSYFVGMGFMLFVMLFLAASFPPLIILQIGLILFYTPTLLRYARRNKSQTFDPTRIPDTLLP